METPLNASARSAGSLISNSTFQIPQFQREYSWGKDEVTDFWSDLSSSLDLESYFIGLIILTEQGERSHVVDGQQRLLTLSLLVIAIYYEAIRRERLALAERLQANFLKSINYSTDQTRPRMVLSDESDNKVFQHILETGEPPEVELGEDPEASQIAWSFDFLRKKLFRDLSTDPFRRLGKWGEFLTDKLYFAVFVHPDASSAYQVYEVINTRGKDLTTADLLKNFILSQSPEESRENYYARWQVLAKRFASEGANSFVQFIRHAITVECGHVLPRDLFAFIAGRQQLPGKAPPAPLKIIDILEARIGLYAQMMDPTLAGPASAEALRVFAALNSLGVIAVRPILMAIAEVSNTPSAEAAMRQVLELVVRRIVVGSLGTGNVERRFGEAAHSLYSNRDLNAVTVDLRDLYPDREDFVRQLLRRSFNKGVLTFLRRSIIQGIQTPDPEGILHFIWTPQSTDGAPLTEEQQSYWAGTLGNTFISFLERRPPDADTWAGFRKTVFPEAAPGEWTDRLNEIETWDADAIQKIGAELAQAGGKVWY